MASRVTRCIFMKWGLWTPSWILQPLPFAFDHTTSTDIYPLSPHDTRPIAYCSFIFLNCFVCDKLKNVLFIKCRPIIHGCYMQSAYGDFLLCHSQRGRDENALISYGILQLLFQGQRAVRCFFPLHLFRFYQLQPQFVNKRLQSRIALYHFIKNHLWSVSHQ